MNIKIQTGFECRDNMRGKRKIKNTFLKIYFLDEQFFQKLKKKT